MKSPFGDAGDARFMATNPLEDADPAQLRRLLASRAEFPDLSRLSDAQVRAHVAAFWNDGKLPAGRLEDFPAGPFVIAGITIEPEVPVVPVPPKKNEAPKKDEQKFKLVEVTLGAARDQLVNLASAPKDATLGRSVAVAAKLDQKKSGVTVYFAVEAGKDNRTSLPADLQAKIKKSATTNADGIAQVQMDLSRFGGDKFKALASLQEKVAPADGGTVTSAEVTVWRKMNYQITADKGAKLPGRDKTFAAFKKTFLDIKEVDENIIQYSDIKSLGYHPFWQFRVDLNASADGDRNVVCVGDHNKDKFYALFKKPKQEPTAHLIMCDAQWDPITGPESTYSLVQRTTDQPQWNATKNKALGVFKPTLNGAGLVQSSRWSWNDGKKTHNGTFADSDISIEKTRQHTAIFQVSVPKKCKAGHCLGCAGGTDIDPSAAHPVEAKLKLQCATGPWAGESGQPGRPQCLIVVNSDVNRFNNTIAHEIGHLFKQVRTDKNWLGIPDHPDQYEKRGGQGSHCKKDATESATRKDQDDKTVYEGGTCVMYHVAVGNTDFCENCALDLRIRDMTNFFK